MWNTEYFVMVDDFITYGEIISAEGFLGLWDL